MSVPQLPMLPVPDGLVLSAVVHPAFLGIYAALQMGVTPLQSEELWGAEGIAIHAAYVLGNKISLRLSLGTEAKQHSKVGLYRAHIIQNTGWSTPKYLFIVHNNPYIVICGKCSLASKRYVITCTAQMIMGPYTCLWLSPSSLLA